MRIFPPRDPEDRVTAFFTVLLFLAITAVAAVLFFFGGTFPPDNAGVWIMARWAAALIMLFCGYLTLQAVFELFVHLTIGPERFIALMIVLGLGTVGYNLLTS